MNEEVPPLDVSNNDATDGINDTDVQSSKQSPIIKEGFMVKKGHVRHNWKSRWFVLFRDKLCYYNLKGDLLPKGTIILKGSSVISPDPEYTKKEYVFRLIEIKGTEYLLQCSDHEQQEDWVGSITKAIRSLNTVAKSNSLKISDRPTLRSPAPSPGAVPKNSDAESLLIIQNRVTNEDLFEAMQDREAGVELKTHKIGDEHCKLCCSGENLVAWLLSWGFVQNRQEGCALCADLLVQAYLHPLGRNDVPLVDSLDRKAARQLFDDSSCSFYRFSSMVDNRVSAVDFDSDSGDDSGEESIIESLQAKIVKQGFLVKKGHRRHNWKLRKFVLYDEPIRLTYYSPKNGIKEKKGKIKLFGAQVEILKIEDEKSETCSTACTKENKKVARDHCFLVRSRKGKEHILQAPCVEELEDWVTHINHLINKFENYDDL